METPVAKKPAKRVILPVLLDPRGRVGGFLVESGLIAGGAAVIAFLVFVFVWRIFMPFSLVLAVGVYVGVSMLLSLPNRDRLSIDDAAASELQRILAEVGARVVHIEAETERIPAPVARTHVHTIARTATSILADLRERPRHVSGARFVFESLLDATVMALDRYQKFSRVSGPAAQRGREVLEHRVFPTIARGLQQLLEKLVQDDLRALNVDVVVLEQMLDLEGLSEAEPLREEVP